MSVIPAVAGVPVDFILFALTLGGVALFHHHTLRVAVIASSPVTATRSVWWWNSATPASVSANRMKSTGTPATAGIVGIARVSRGSA